MSVVEVNCGTSPVILAFPHTGTDVPPDIAARLNAEGQVLRDTDWHIHRLYEGLLADATTVRAAFHRYCIDANRDPSGTSLYPGQNTTGLIPITNFDGASIWCEGKAPDEAEISVRIARFHAPYHAALCAEIDRVKALHGVAILYDCHSIRSAIPFLFEGRLPDFNIGTDGGVTCDPVIERAAVETCTATKGYTSILNGRFRGGWTVRHYGRPEAGVHAIQMELAQVSHLATEAPPFDLDRGRAQALRELLRTLLRRIEASAHSLGKPA
ncbi:N-formylglutamate deformylase [Methylobacterium brachiatum]|uniref:N-formylglutamate deformylase n=1 Tax=Methylobacterium brachiatum TaxID=269660 RepID=UPI0024478478|nr:N-formylglutamate deformylase [Methylobacterium brachiatum]MDH2312378.1 N-formylglutamate deformylase [Methylobacterium brachiatum]